MEENHQNVLRYLPLFRAALTNDWAAAERIFDGDSVALTSKITYREETALHVAVGTNSSHHFVVNLVNRIADVDRTMLRTPNCWGNTSLHFAAKAGNTEAAKVLVGMDPEMASIANKYGNTAVKFAARYGRKDTLVFLLSATPNVIGEDGRSPYSGEVGGDLITLTISAGFYVPFMKHIHETKLTHRQTSLLTKALIAKVLEVPNAVEVWRELGTAVSAAAKHGIHELVEECVGRYPGLVWYKIEKVYLFSAAIKYRQVKVYNLIYQMTGHVVFAGNNATGKDNALHLAGRKPSPHRLSTVTGAALQMQRELQWFKEVEKFVEPSFREALNDKNQTPRMVFTDEHKDLVEKGEKWMKDTASSSTVVAALIVTVTFAAIFTSPGGTKDDGTPYFLQDSTFILFAASDALALFSSVTSVLMFLSMLTSRYAEDDFLYKLPKRITLGLGSLFISIAAIMVTFCAAMVLALRKELPWIALPVGLVACVPVTFFALLQFPLLVELVVSTYGRSIFHKQNEFLLH